MVKDKVLIAAIMSVCRATVIKQQIKNSAGVDEPFGLGQFWSKVLKDSSFVGMLQE